MGRTTQQTIDNLFCLDNCADCIALYVFYYKTAKWQNTNIIKANDAYIKKALKWGINKIRNTKQTLKENGLIDIVQRRKNGKISGWYVKVSYIINPKSIEDIKITVDNENNATSNNIPNEQVQDGTSSKQDTSTIKYNISTIDNNISTAKNEKSVSVSKKSKKDKAVDLVIAKFEEYDFSDKVKEKLLEFYEDRIDNKDYPGNNQLTVMFNELSEVSEQKQLEAISNSIKQGYKGIFINKNNSKKQSYRLDTTDTETVEEHNQRIAEIKQRIDNNDNEQYIF